MMMAKVVHAENRISDPDMKGSKMEKRVNKNEEEAAV